MVNPLIISQNFIWISFLLKVSPGDPKTACDVTIPHENYHPNCATSEAPEEKMKGNKDGFRFLGMLPFEKPNFIFPFPFPLF